MVADGIFNEGSGGRHFVWRAETAPDALFHDRGLARAARGIRGALRAEAGDGCVMLALPIDDTAPIPLMAAFCLGAPLIIGGLEYLVFAVRSGSPADPMSRSGA
jgi:hypothetical protein